MEGDAFGKNRTQAKTSDAFPCAPVFSLLDRAREAYGPRPAFDFLGKRWSWREIADLSDQMAAGLQSIGVGPGVRVGLFLPNTPCYLIAYYAILRAGAVVVNYNPLYAERELRAQIEDSGTTILVTLDLTVLWDKAAPMLENTGLEKIILCRFTDFLPFPKNFLFRLFKGAEQAKIEPGHDSRVLEFSDLLKKDTPLAPVTIDPENDIALLQYTGGTTGIPKGAGLTHHNIIANTEQCALWFFDARAGQEKMLGVLPFFHVFAMTAIMNLSVRLGFEIIATPRFDLEDTLRIISRKKPHYFPAVPAIYNAINTHPDIKKYNLSSLRYCVSGGAPLPVEVKRSFERNTGCTLVEGYGLTEASPVVCVNPIHDENRAGSIGLPLPGTQLRTVSLTDGKTPVPAGERGELCVRGPQVMKGYWNRPDETDKVLIDGWLHTGDIAVLDADGYVYIVDRLKDMIITNGYNVYPRNVEEAVYMNPSVEECIVAGVPDPARGEAVKIWLRLKPGRRMTTEDLREFLTDKLSPMEIPRHIEFRDTPLPRTLIGKLSRKDILDEEQNGKPIE